MRIRTIPSPSLPIPLPSSVIRAIEREARNNPNAGSVSKTTTVHDVSAASTLFELTGWTLEYEIDILWA